MTLRYLLCLTAFFSVCAAAQGPVVPETLVRSKYVYIGILRADGGIDDRFNPAASEDDRKIRAEVERAFSQWKRYNVTHFPQDADLIVLVKRGRYGSVTAISTPDQVSVKIGRTAKQEDPMRNPRGVAVAADAGPAIDRFEVRSGPTRGQDIRLWQATRKDGLDGAPPRLFAEYKDAVEGLAKKLGL